MTTKAAFSWFFACFNEMLIEKGDYAGMLLAIQ